MSKLRMLLVMAIAVFSVSAYAQQLVTCSSDDGQRHVCAADIRGGVQLTNQRSGDACQRGYSWGTDSAGIWVDHGCRADFTVIAYNPSPQYGQNGLINCSSDDGNRHSCPVDARGGVQLTNQRSGAACQQGYSWGTDPNGIWVDHGCRADFTVLPYNPNPQVGAINCSSDDGNRHYCEVDTRDGVRLVNQRSGSPCERGISWGADRRGIWVDHGCRADFQLGGGGYPAVGAVISCSSDDGERHTCAADTRGGVRLVRQLSGSACQHGSSWGTDRNGIWVDHGCRAEFEAGGGWQR